MVSRISTKELYEQLSPSPERRRTIAERIFRQLRHADSGRSLGGFAQETLTDFGGMMRTRTAK